MGTGGGAARLWQGHKAAQAPVRHTLRHSSICPGTSGHQVRASRWQASKTRSHPQHNLRSTGANLPTLRLQTAAINIILREEPHTTHRLGALGSFLALPPFFLAPPTAGEDQVAACGRPPCRQQAGAPREATRGAGKPQPREGGAGGCKGDCGYHLAVAAARGGGGSARVQTFCGCWQ